MPALLQSVTIPRRDEVPCLRNKGGLGVRSSRNEENFCAMTRARGRNCQMRCSVYPPWRVNGARLSRGCERHRWVKPRGRNERERLSQRFWSLDANPFPFPPCSTRHGSYAFVNPEAALAQSKLPLAAPCADRSSSRASIEPKSTISSGPTATASRRYGSRAEIHDDNCGSPRRT